jgi:hypothetical protein
MMDINEIAHALESAFAHAYPGREAVEPESMLREVACFATTMKPV